MKQILMLTMFLMFITSCKKDSVISKPKDLDYVSNVKSFLKDSIDNTTYEVLDFGKAVKTSINLDTSFLRIPFKETNSRNEFLLLQTNQQGSIKRGRVVSFDKYNSAALRMKKYRPYNGHIVIKDLKGRKVLESEIENGYILSLHPKRKNHRLAVVPLEPYYTDLPEVVVVSLHTQESGISYSDWYSFSGIFSDTYTYNNYYSSMDGYGGVVDYSDNGYSYDVTSQETNYLQKPTGYVYEEPAMLVDYEAAAYDPAIDLQKYLNCFSRISDAGAISSIEIFADIPVDGDPNKLLNYQTGSPGHTFIKITKSNGGQSVSQNIGFYPDEGWKVSLSNAPVDGKFVDNSGHEYNASLKMILNAMQVKRVLTEIGYLARFIKYDIDEYNCTDFALDVFNKARSESLKIPMYEIPGGMTVGGTRTPQGLYNQLKSMKQSGSPEAANIMVSKSKFWTSKSTGPCN
jgi:hypothetical protein